MKLPVSLLESIARRLVNHPRVLFIGACLYILSPIDLIPEAVFGPIGLIDDLVVLLLPFIVREYVHRLDKRKPPTPDVVDTTLD